MLRECVLVKSVHYKWHLICCRQWICNVFGWRAKGASTKRQSKTRHRSLWQFIDIYTNMKRIKMYKIIYSRRNQIKRMEHTHGIGIATTVHCIFIPLIIQILDVDNHNKRETHCTYSQTSHRTIDEHYFYFKYIFLPFRLILRLRTKIIIASR